MTTMTIDERRIAAQLTAALALPAVINMIPADCFVGGWRVETTGIEACVHAPGRIATDDGVRESMLALADRLGMKYDEEPHGEGRYKVSAVGAHEGVRIELWDLTPRPEQAETEVAK